MTPASLPMVIDTDIGDDIDDALALALAVNSPEVDLRGVSVVYGDVATRSRLARKLLATYDRADVPVATGCGAPLMGACPTHVPNQAVVLEEGETLPEPSPQRADDLIRRAADEAGGRLVVVTIGAMTNMALALLRDRRLARRASLVLMGGMAGRHLAEWNIRCDPEAARICFESGMPITMVGLDVTLECRMTAENVDAIRTWDTPPTDLLARMIDAWRGTGDAGEKPKLPILHDPLAVAVAFRPEIVTAEPRHVAVETRGEFTRAYTVTTQDGEPNTQVCLGVDSAGFLGLFMERLLQRG